MIDTENLDHLSRVTFVTRSPRINEGGAEAIEKWLDEHPEARLVVVDVLERIRPLRNAKANAYGEDYAALKELSGIAKRRKVAILVIHHTRKAGSDDAMHAVSGTQGLTGAADGAWVLERARGESRGTLHVMCRDLPRDASYAVEFDDARWSMVGLAGAIAKSAAQRAILDALNEAKEPIGPTQIAALIGKSRQAVLQTLNIMVREGLVRRAGGKYSAADLTTEDLA